MLARPTILLLVVLLYSVQPAMARPANVRDHGAKGDDRTDDTRAFVAALKASRNVYVPAGTYRIGTITLPDKTYLHGDGRASVIRFVAPKDAKAGVNVGSSCRLSNLRFTGTKPFENWITGKGSMNPVMLLARGKQDIEIDRVKIDDYRHNAIWLEGCQDVRVTGCVLEKLFHGMEIDSCKRIHVMGNRLREMRNHGIQFWGQSNFTRMLCEDLIFANNYVYHGGSGAIWGTGARRVVMNNNVIDGAKDIGLDLEWCYDCSITGNTTKNCWNAGIALFLSCKNVAITGNSLFIDDSKEGRRDGIMLTGVNRGLYRKDFGHRNISITGNTIHAEGKHRHGISVGSGYNIVCSANTMRNADVLDRTGRVLITGTPTGSARGQSLSGVTVMPLGPTWQFAVDPKNKGVTRQWYARRFDDAKWATVRSDQIGVGWEGQGFGGKTGKGYVGYAWYRAQLPKVSTKRRFAYLHFGMTDEQSWIYLNGKEVGEHTVKSQGKAMQAMWDEPFGIEVSKHLVVGKTNDLAVRIHNAALAGGLRRPASLILSDKRLSVTEQIRATNAYRRQQVLQGAVKWPKLLRAGSKLLLRESFERYEIGDDPAKRLWSYATHGNEQWEGDTTYVVDETTHGIHAYDGSKAFFLEQFTYQGRYDVCAKPIIQFPRQTSGTVRMAFALFPRAGLALAFGDSKKKALLSPVMIGKDNKVRFKEKDRWVVSQLIVSEGRWNAILIELKPGSGKATLTVNNNKRASFPLKLDAIDRLKFQVSGYGTVMLDSLMVVHESR